MADTKISALTAGTATSGDQVPVNRAGTNYRVTVQDIAALRVPAGSDTQVQFNDGSAFAGNAGLTFDKTNQALTVGGATVTTDNPVLNLSQTWNAGAVSFNGIKLTVTNTASATGSALLNLVAGSQTRFQVFPVGATASDTEVWLTNAAGNATLRVYTSGGWLLKTYSSTTGRGSLYLDTGGGVTLSSTNGQILTLVGAGGVRITNNSVNANLTCATGTLICDLAVKTVSTTVASLPAAATAGAGARAFVTDATATTFLSTVAGGGANKVPVVSDGTNWLIG